MLAGPDMEWCQKICLNEKRHNQPGNASQVCASQGVPMVHSQ